VALTDITSVLAAIVRGGRSSLPVLNALAPEDVFHAADRHGVLPLVANRLVAWDSPGTLLDSQFGREYRRRAARDLLRERELRDCLAELSLHAVPALLMKGAELAYTHYARPDLRPRLDTDILVRVADRDRAGAALKKCGYESAGQFPGDLVMYQEPYTKRIGNELVHVIDVHWRISNPQVFGRALSFEELAQAAVPVSALGPSARGLAPTHALLLACIHRIAHHAKDERLIWLYDIHLLASNLDDASWAEFVQLARARGVATVCLQGLRRTVHCFQTIVPAAVEEGLAEGLASPEDKATAAYLGQRRRHVQNILADLRALPEWRSRLRLAMEHLLPSPAYMRGVYAPSSNAPLPLLYVRRAVKGARKWFRRAQ
jgi:putative nucleotidyltransferase-like protein